MSKAKALLVMYGEGGHEAEMKLLLNRLPQLQSSDFEFVAFTEGAARQLVQVKYHFQCRALRSKDKGIQLGRLIKAVCKNTQTLLSILRRWDVRVMITTGPGIAIFGALFGRMFGIKIIHIETNCRFYSKSLTGRCLYALAHHFYVQNKELLSVYPKAKWCGRL